MGEAISQIIYTHKIILLLLFNNSLKKKHGIVYTFFFFFLWDSFSLLYWRGGYFLSNVSSGKFFFLEEKWGSFIVNFSFL